MEYSKDSPTPFAGGAWIGFIIHDLALSLEYLPLFAGNGADNFREEQARKVVYSNGRRQRVRALV